METKKMGSQPCKIKIGDKFNKLTIVDYVGNDKHNKRKWLCLCDCGNKTVVTTSDLTTGHTKSCGCYFKESHIKHGKSKDRLYSIWNSMIHRVTDISSISYVYYGKRGVTICKEWLDDFMNFYDWSIQNGYNDDLSLERINVNGNYDPNNCKWILPKDQARNKTNSITIEYCGKIYTSSEISEITGVKSATIYERIRRGWSAEKIFKTPTLKCGGNYK